MHGSAPSRMAAARMVYRASAVMAAASAPLPQTSPTTTIQQSSRTRKTS